MTLFVWQAGAFTASTRYVLPDAATSLAFAGGRLAAASTAALHLLEGSGRVTEVARWRTAAPAALAAMPAAADAPPALCIVQGGSVVYLSLIHI